MEVLIVSLLVVAAVNVGCAGSAGTPGRYRVSGMVPTRIEKGIDTYVVQLEGCVEYSVQATVTSGVARFRTVVRNGGGESVRYDLQRAVVSAADGDLLRLVDTEEEPSSRPSEIERTSEGYLHGVRVIAPGQQNAITRRYVLADRFRRGRDLLLLARLSFGDVVRVSDRETRVALRLEQER
jgi:hypothetical protein